MDLIVKAKMMTTVRVVPFVTLQLLNVSRMSEVNVGATIFVLRV